MDDSVSSDIKHLDSLGLRLVTGGFGLLGVSDENIEMVVECLA